jgi:hypothetical protein
MAKVEKSMMRESTGPEPNLQRVDEQAQGGEEKERLDDRHGRKKARRREERRGIG